MRSSLADRSRILNANVIEFINHPSVIEGHQDLSEGVNHDSYYKVMYLIAALIQTSGTCPGAVENMTIAGIENYTSTNSDGTNYSCVYNRP